MKKVVKNESVFKGYKLTNYSDKGTLLSCQGQPVFIIGSGVDIQGDFLVRLVKVCSELNLKRIS